MIDTSEAVTHFGQSWQRWRDTSIMHRARGFADNGGIRILKEQRDLWGIQAPQCQ